MTHFKGAWKFSTFMLLFFCIDGINALTFSYNHNLLEAQKLIAQLRLKKAAEILESERKINPDNAAIDYLANYIDFYTLFMNQDEEELKRLEPNKSVRISRLDKIPVSSPYHDYAQAQLYLQWAFIHVFHEHYLSAAVELRHAYQLLTANVRKFPAFAPNQKDLGLLKTMLGAVPENYKWVLTLAGMKGDVTEGMRMIREFNEMSLSHEWQLEEQSGKYYYVLLALNFAGKEETWKYCEMFTRSASTNLFETYLRAYVSAKCGYNDEAIATLSKRPADSDFPVFYLLDYHMGICKLNKLDDEADLYLKKVVSFYKGKSTVRDAYKRLAWYNLIKGYPDKYKIYRNLSIKYGSPLTDEEKQAEKEKRKNYLPNIELMKARLLFDGGYYAKAEETMKTDATHNLVNTYQRIEYHYRLARILHEQKKYSKAIDEYQKTVDLTGNENFYFAPNSCLQLGIINEKLGFIKTAKLFYEKTLSYKSYEHQSGISQKAKAALNRLRN